MRAASLAVSALEGTSGGGATVGVTNGAGTGVSIDLGAIGGVCCAKLETANKAAPIHSIAEAVSFINVTHTALSVLIISNLFCDHNIGSKIRNQLTY
jgi:hypothetical protein